jgi:hypothetical protein
VKASRNPNRSCGTDGGSCSVTAATSKTHTGPGSLAMNVQTVKKARASDRTEKAASPCRKSLISCCCILDRVVLLLLLTAPMPRDSTVPCNKTVVDPLGFASLRNALLGAMAVLYSYYVPVRVSILEWGRSNLRRADADERIGSA